MSVQTNELSLHGKLIPPAQIESELLRVWREAAREAAKQMIEDQPADPYLRAILSNVLLVLSEQSFRENQQTLDKIISEICINYPSRIFVVILRDEHNENNGEQEVLKTSVSSRCVIATNGSHVCSEEIYIAVRKEREEAASSLLLSLFTPGVASFSIFLEDPLRGDCIDSSNKLVDLFSLIGDSIDFVLFDSLKFGKFTIAYELLRGLFRDENLLELRAREVVEVSDELRHNISRVRLKDFAWMRIAKWRDLITQQFDAPLMQKSVGDLKSIELVYSADGASTVTEVSSEAVLLAGWIASVLGYVVLPDGEISSESKTILCRAGNGKIVKMQFIVDNSGGKVESHVGASNLLSVSMVVSGAEGEFEIRFEKNIAEGLLKGVTLPVYKGGEFRESEVVYSKCQLSDVSSSLDRLILSAFYPSGREQSFEAALVKALELDAV